MAHLQVPYFQYPELGAKEPSIRLLRIFTDNSEAGFSCHLQAFSLASCPPYKALSYTWGSPFLSEKALLPTGQPFLSDEDLREREVDWISQHHRISCNEAVAYISLNLFELLGQLSSMAEGFLWIDRLCIDQGNKVEKSVQVKLMSKIYSQATSVVIWLGRGDRDSLAASEIQENFAGPLYELASEGKLSEADMQTHDPGNTQFEMESYRERYGLRATMPLTWFAWTQLFRRAWFYRRWTLQETALADHIEVLCGNQRLDWYKLKFLVRYFGLSGWKRYLRRLGIPENDPTRAMLARNLVEFSFSETVSWKNELAACYGKFTTGVILTELLYRSSMLQCLKPQDMLFSMFGILDTMDLPEPLINLKVDYDIEVPELYSKVAQICLENCPDLSILSLIRDSTTRSTPNLPSWVPDLQEISQHRIARRLGLDRRRPSGLLYKAAYDPCITAPLRYIRGSALHLRGVKIGNIVSRCVDLSSGDGWRYLPSIIDIYGDLPLVMRDGQTRMQALWKTMTADSEAASRPAPADLEKCFQDFILKDLFIWRETEEDWPEGLTIICDRLRIFSEGRSAYPFPDVSRGSVWWDRLQSTSEGSSFEKCRRYNIFESMVRFRQAIAIGGLPLFRTTEGDLGFGPPSCSSVDQVWVLENGRVPFVLRPSQDLASFEFIGECYVHGIMDGQVFANDKLKFIPLSLV
jgi:hypothetical protein